MKNLKSLNAIHLIILSLFYLLLTSFTNDTLQFANGADIGWLSQMEASSYKFYNDSGVQENCMQILKEKGINSLRFRVWVNPTGGWCGKKDVATMAHRADSMGFRIMIDFHYSDWWADPGKQTKPAAWASDSLSQLLSDIYNHTYDVLDTLKTIGIIPEWVQVGNETNDGMLWPDGRASTSMKNFASMVTSGYNAIKAIDSSIMVIVHISNGYDNGLFRWMFDGLKNNSAKWDAIGMSLYPSYSSLTWSVANNRCLSNMNDMVTRYQKKVMVVEVGMPYNQEYACNAFLLDLINKTKSVTGGLGVFYWEPECYNWQGYNLGAWRTNGRPSLAMDAFLGISHLDPTEIGSAGKNSDIRMNPNPLSGNQQNLIVSGLKGRTNIKIATINGHFLFDQEITGNSAILNNLNLLPGIYFVQIDNQQQKEVKTLIIK